MLMRLGGVGCRRQRISLPTNGNSNPTKGTLVIATVQPPLEYKNLLLMAIGDSMYQVVRFLTMNAPLVRHSPSAQAARALGLEFKDFGYSDPKRPILLDMEAFIRLPHGAKSQGQRRGRLTRDTQNCVLTPGRD